MIDPTERSFIDASVFLLDVFDDEKYGEYCHRLIIKIENNVIQGITSIMVLDEVLFKMLIMEASNKFDINIGGASRYLKENPDKIPTLEKSWENIDKISSIFDSNSFYTGYILHFLILLILTHLRPKTLLHLF